MATIKSKFPVEKPYLKVEKNTKSWSSSSSRQADLSYSYSCVKAFEKNQYIIAELAFTHNKAHFKGLSHEPVLYSLSGDREKPVCQPFYYSTHSDHHNSEFVSENITSTRQQVRSEYEPNLLQQQPYKVNRSSRQDIVQDFHSECEPEFPDLQVFIQWLKYQFKYINYLWPFSKTNYNCITNLCKRNKKMKMEMLLNNLNEDTKSKLKTYLAQMNLSMEEKFSLCNESIIEIDITPIAENPERLQAFLIFLRSLESRPEKDSVEKSGLDSTKVMGNIKEKQKGLNPKQVVEKSKLTENIFYKDVNTASNNRQPNKLNQVDTEINKGKLLESHSKPSKNGKLESGTHRRSHSDKNTSYNKIIDESEMGNYIFDSENCVPKIDNRNLSNKFINNKSQLQSDRKIPTETPENKTRTNFNNSDTKAQVQNMTNAMHTVKKIGNTNNQVIYAHRALIGNIGNNQFSSPEGNVSCKCLLHQSREDYIRYKNQCLFGKGDEDNNKFIKYVISNNEKCEANISAKEIRPVHMNNQTVLEGNVDDDPPSVTKLISDDKVKTASGAKPRIIQNKSRKNKGNEKSVSCNKSNTHETGNHENQQNKSNTSSAHNGLNNDCLYCSKNIYLDDKNNFIGCGKIGVDDVEKLVCAVNLSDNTIVSDCFSVPAENNNNNQNLLENNYKQDTFNACFESLDYSINSFSSNYEGNASLKQAILISNSQKPINKPSNLTHENHSISSRNSNQNREVNNSFNSNRLNRFEHESLDSEKQSDYSYQSYPYKYYEECSKNSDRTEENHDNSSVLTNGKTNPTMVKISPNQMHVLIKNTNELERDIFHVNQCLPPVNKVLDTRQQQESRKPNKTNVLIRINSVEKQPVSESTQTSSTKKHLKLNSLKPRNIYRSISSIFKGNRTKYKEGSRNVSDKTSSLECYNPVSRGNSSDGRGQVASCQNGKQPTTPQSNTSSQCDEQLLITCLEKLYEQMARQQNEIRNIKQVLNKHIK